MKTKSKKILSTILAMITVLIVFTAQGAVLTVLGLQGTVARLVSGAIVWVLPVAALIFFKVKKTSLADIGFKKPEQGSLAKLFYLIPLIAVALLGAVGGVDFSRGAGYIFSCLFYTLAIGFAEEIYFRGIICNVWKSSGEKKATLISAALFGMCHILQAIANPSPVATILAVCFAFFYGIAFAQIFLTTKSIIPAIAIHVFHDFCSFIGASLNERTNVILGAIQTVLILGFIIAVYFRNNKREKKKADRRKKAMIPAVIIAAVVVIGAVVIAIIAFGKHQMSLIPKMTSTEILEYTLKGSESGVITVGVIKDGKASYTVYGKDGKPVENALHTYEIGSLTKTVTASLVNKAVREGKIDIDAPLDRYLELPPKEHYPTIRELLTHTSGYKPYYLDGCMMSSHFRRNNDFYGVGDSDILNRLKKENINAGDYKFNYSNFGYATLGLILEKVYETEYTTLVNNYVQNELGMTATHISQMDGDLGNYWDWQAGDTYLAAGGLLSNIEDMLKYAQYQLSEASADSHALLKTVDANNASYEAMGIRFDGASYGWIYDAEGGFLWHNGGTSNYNSYLAFSAEDNTAVVVLSNLSPNARIPATVLGRKILAENIGR